MKHNENNENGELQAILDKSSIMTDVCLLRDSPYRILRVSIYLAKQIIILFVQIIKAKYYYYIDLLIVNLMN